MLAQLELIKEKDSPFYESLMALVLHVSKTYGDKYEATKNAIDMKKYYGGCREVAKPYNIGNACKYISRYDTKGFDKSEQPADLLKAIHYLLFEYVSVNNGSKQIKNTQ